MRIALIVTTLVIGCGGNARDAREPSARTAETARTTQTTEITSATVAPAPKTLDARHIRERIEGRLAQLVERCGELQWETDRYATTLHLEIAPNGTVEMADARGNHTRLDACVAEIARTWTFDRAAVRTVTTVPVVIERPQTARRRSTP